MPRFLVWSFVLLAFFSFSVSTFAEAVSVDIPDPESVFGFTPGADRKLIDYEQLIDYVERVAEASPRVAISEIGRTALDRPMKLVLISSPENLDRLDEIRSINRRLALDPSIPDAERAALVEATPVTLMATLSMHSTEVAPAQTLPLLTYSLATTDDPETLKWLDDVVIMVVACLNPDGMDMIVNHYRENLGTPYEGGSMPGLYHHYVGHDNNRDFVALTQAESRVVSRVFSTEWYPQILIDKHQMGRTGPRYFVPRYHDPIAENIDGGLWTWSDVFGSGMAREIELRVSPVSPATGLLTSIGPVRPRHRTGRASSAYSPRPPAQRSRPRSSSRRTSSGFGARVFRNTRRASICRVRGPGAGGASATS